MEAGSLERPAEAGKGKTGSVRRWILELELAKKREKDWVAKAEKVWDRYRQRKSRKHSFNILYSNTETLAPALYIKPPEPDVRRRFRDADPKAKTAAEMLERALTYSVDAGDWHEQWQAVVLDMLLPGRGVARIRYVPSLQEVGTPAENEEEASHEADEGTQEELAWQQVDLEHVQWDDFRHGPGRSWQQVQWVAFRLRLTRDELCEKFGDEIGEQVPLDNIDPDDKRSEEDSETSVFRTAEVWEIWDKQYKKVCFVCAGYKDAPLKEEADPLELAQFFPCPRPLMSFPDSADLTPTPLYELYREQAEELDRVTFRINKIISALKARGVYDSVLTEMPDIFKGDDADMIPIANAQQYSDRAGLDKAIWFLPIDMLANVLKELYVQREQVKQVIYEITGISDILRGASNPNETATAQGIKNQWGTLRLQKQQREVQRFIRDCIRMAGEIIGQTFLPDTLEKMTGIQLPSQVQQMQAAMQAQQAGQQPPPPQPTIEDVMGILRDDLQRQFRIDIETDSTIADSQTDDMKGLSDVLGAIGQAAQTLMPLVQMQALPIDGFKAVLQTVARRAKMGSAVEDELDKMQAPKPQPDPKIAIEQQKAQAKQQADQQALQMKQQEQQAAQQQEQQRMQFEMQMREREMAMEQQYEMRRQQMESHRAQQEAQFAMQQEAMAAMLDDKFQRWKAILDADTKIAVAEIGKEATIETAQVAASVAKVREDE